MAPRMGAVQPWRAWWHAPLTIYNNTKCQCDCTAPCEAPSPPARATPMLVGGPFTAVSFFRGTAFQALLKCHSKWWMSIFWVMGCLQCRPSPSGVF